ncbi:MAG: hypothetical protein JRH20_01640 [Deltaproteobacteria bacterium]|nr:hypothetical protein [Deltaproteobacteria bacterium]
MCYKCKVADQEHNAISMGALRARVMEFEVKLKQLKLAYEQYFLGMEKREPQQAQQEVARMMRTLDQQYISNTALSYRYKGLVARFNTYRNYWNRTLRAIEAGTYHRDVARVKRKLAREGIEIPKLSELRSPAEVERALRDVSAQRERKSADAIRGRAAVDLREQLSEEPPPLPPEPDMDATGEFDAQLDDAFDSLLSSQSVGAPQATAPQATAPQPPSNTRRTSPTQPPAATPSPRAPTECVLPPGFSREEMDSLYRRFVKAKKMCGNDPSTVKYDSLVRTITKQLPKIRGGDETTQVNFQVVIRNGRAILKAKKG